MNINIKAIESLLSKKPDLSILRQYLGWGKFAKDLLDDKIELPPLPIETINKLKDSTLTAYYTTDEMSEFMWRYASHYFKDDQIKVLEPGCGVGQFFKHIPDGLQIQELVGVEVEPIAAKIAQRLYPNATIYDQDFSDFIFPDNYFDLVIGNVPYGQFQISENRYRHLSPSIHDYFLCKSADLLKPGGMMVVLTSPYTLNKKSSLVREYLADRLILVDAIALPEGTFRKMGTDTSEHLLVFIKDPVNPSTNSTKIKKWIAAKEVAYNPYPWTGMYGQGAMIVLNECFLNEYRDRECYNRVPLAQQRILGKPTINSLYNDGFSVAPDDRDFMDNLNLIFNNTTDLLDNISVYIDKAMLKIESPEEKPETGTIVPPHLAHVANYEYIEHEGSFYQRLGAYLYEIPKTAKIKGGRKHYEVEVHDRLRDFWDLAKVVKLVVASQANTEDLRQYQAVLTVAYDNFVKRWGLLKSPISDPKGNSIKKKFNPNEEILKDQPDYQIASSVEDDRGFKTPIFTTRVAKSYHVPSVETDIEKAIAYTRNVCGRLDVKYLAKLTQVSLSALIEFLGKHKFIYFDPSLGTEGEWVEAEEYLSGNVRNKLAVAQAYEGVHGKLDANIEALQEVLPLPILAPVRDELKIAMLERVGINYEELDDKKQTEIINREIVAKLGSQWIPVEIYEKFLELIDVSQGKVVYLPSIGGYHVSGWSRDRTRFGTDEKNSKDIFDLVINQKPIKINIYEDKQLDIPRTEAATLEAQTAAESMKEYFLEWLWQEDDRAMDLFLNFNNSVNVYVPRKWDGSWLELPGTNPIISLNPWQKDGVAQIISSRTTFFDWDVGTGKTYTAIAGIMECRRLGLAKKPVFVALNGTENQIYRDFKKLYPAAKVLMFESVGFEARNRFMASLVVSDFDCAILTHSQFFMLTMGIEYQISYYTIIRQQLEEIKADLDGERSVASKRIEARLKSIKNRLNDLRGESIPLLEKEYQEKLAEQQKASSDEHKEFLAKEARKIKSKITRLKNRANAIKFEQLGIDMIVFDEVHVAKNLEVSTMLGDIKGIPTAYSQRASDTYQKFLYLQDEFLEDFITDKFKGIIVGMTGTTLSNTIGELYNWMRMFSARTMKEQEMMSFDSWASRFAEVSSTLEVNLKQQWRYIYRFKSFHNFETLMPLLRQFMSTVTFEDIESILKRPKPVYISEVVAPSATQMAFMNHCVRRAYAYSTGTVDPRDDNPLKITTDINKASLSMRNVGEREEFEDSKLHKLCFNVWKIWEVTKPVKGAQLIFCDFSTPKSNRYNAYSYCKNILLALGIPSQEIAFIHNYTGESRSELLERVNSGEVRVLFGSTAKLGTGVNAHQGGLWAVHHLDAPWVPTAITQREGRMIRQGNGERLLGDGRCLEKAWDFKYLTERMEILRWQLLQAKQEMVYSFRRGFDLSKNIKDIDSEAMSYEQIKAEASGSTVLQDMARLQARKKELKLKQQNHAKKQASLILSAKKIESQIESYNRLIDGLEFEIERLKPCDLENEAVKFGTTKYTNRKEAGEAIAGGISAFQKEVAKSAIKSEVHSKLFSFAGVDCCATYSVLGRTSYTLETRNAIIDLPLQISHVGKNKEISWLRQADNAIPSLIEIIKALPQHLEYMKEDQKALAIELKRVDEERGKGFDAADELQDIEVQIKQIESQLESEGLSQEPVYLQPTKFDASTSEGDDDDDWFAEIGAEKADLNSAFDPAHIEYIKSWESPQWLDDITRQVRAVQLESIYRKE